jgi:hypothetical protein
MADAGTFAAKLRTGEPLVVAQGIHLSGEACILGELSAGVQLAIAGVVGADIKPEMGGFQVKNAPGAAVRGTRPETAPVQGEPPSR